MIKNIDKKLIKIKLSMLKPYFDNPRHNSKSAKIVAESIKKFGYICPIITNPSFIILAGNTRYKALKMLNVEDIEVIVVSGLTPDEEREFVIADNKIGEYSTWNQSAINRLVDNNENSDFLNGIGIKSSKDIKKQLEDLISGDK